MQFRPLNRPPERFTPCLIRRDMEQALRVNDVTWHGIKERRSEIVVSYWTGSHWLGRDAHWKEWAEIPPEYDRSWNSTSIVIPEEMKPVLSILPQPVDIGMVTISAGFHFAFYKNKTWCVYQRSISSRGDTSKLWIDIGNKRISSWLQLPPLNEKLRSS